MRRPLCLVCIVYLSIVFLSLFIFDKRTVVFPYKEGETVLVTGKLYKKECKQGKWILYLTDIRSVEAKYEGENYEGRYATSDEIGKYEGENYEGRYVKRDETGEYGEENYEDRYVKRDETGEYGEENYEGRYATSDEIEGYGEENYDEDSYDRETDSPACKGVICYLSEDVPMQYEPKLGSYVKVEGTYRTFDEATNLGQFNAQSYYQFLNLDFSITNSKILNKTKEYNHIKESLYLLKKKWSDGYKNTCTKEEAAFFSSIVLGDKSDMDEEIKGMFSRNGFAHILAVSGLHISFIGMAFYKLLRRTPIPTFWQIMISCLIIYLYGVMIHAGASTNRAIIMFVIHLFARILGRTYDMATALATAAMILVIMQPVSLTNSGFLLSFGAVLAILIFFPIIKNCFELPEKFRSHTLLSKTWEMFLLSFSINFITLPILLTFYYEFPVYSAVLNVIVIPLFSFVLLFAVMGGIVAMFHVGAGSVLLFPCKVVFAFYQLLCDVADNLPGARWIAGKPQTVGIVMFYVIVLSLVVVVNLRNGKHEGANGERSTEGEECESGSSAERGEGYENGRSAEVEEGYKSGGRKVKNYNAKRWILVCVMVVSVFILTSHPHRQTTVTFLDIGQGDCCVIHTENGQVILVDGGSSDVSESGTGRLIPFLKASGISRVDYAFISHPDSDHVNSLLECLSLQKTEGVYIQNIILSEYGKNDENYQEIKNASYEAGCNLYYFQPGDSLRFGSRDEVVLVRCLFPSGEEGITDVNEQSMVLAVQIGEVSILFTGDIGQDAERRLLESRENGKLRADILKVAHHGSKYSTSEEFLMKVCPQVAVISCGRDNSYGHPHEETLERLEAAGAQVYITADVGAVTIYIEDKGVCIDSYVR